MKKMPSNTSLIGAMAASALSAMGIAGLAEAYSKGKAKPATNIRPMVTSSDLDIARHNALIDQRKAQKHRDRMAALAANNQIYQSKFTKKG